MKQIRRLSRTFALLLAMTVLLSVFAIAAGAVDFSATTIKASGTSRVEGENWMAGGQGVAFYERTYQTDPRAYASPRGERPADSSNESTFVPQAQAWGGASNGLMLGWMDANEWVRYEIDVQEAGTYQVGLLVGSGYKNVVIDVYLDANPEGGTLLGSVEVPCNGFYNMTLEALGDVELPAGSHTLKVLVRHAKGLGGLNLVGVDIDYIQFTRKQADEPDVTEPNATLPPVETLPPVTQAPTQAPATQAPTQAPATQAPTQTPATQAPTQTPATQAPTQTPATQAPTQAPATEPAATEPAATEPAATEPAATEPAATEPAATEPAATEPEATEPEATEPAVTEPAVTEPSATEPAPVNNEADPLMIVVIVVTAVLVLAVIGLGAYYIVSSKKSSK